MSLCLCTQYLYNMCIYMYTYIHTYIYTSIRTYIYRDISIYTYVHTHTHRPKQSLPFESLKIMVREGLLVPNNI